MALVKHIGRHNFILDTLIHPTNLTNRIVYTMSHLEYGHGLLEGLGRRLILLPKGFWQMGFMCLYPFHINISP